MMTGHECTARRGGRKDTNSPWSLIWEVSRFRYPSCINHSINYSSQAREPRWQVWHHRHLRRHRLSRYQQIPVGRHFHIFPLSQCTSITSHPLHTTLELHRRNVRTISWLYRNLSLTYLSRVNWRRWRLRYHLLGIRLKGGHLFFKFSYSFRQFVVTRNSWLFLTINLNRRLSLHVVHASELRKMSMLETLQRSWWLSIEKSTEDLAFTDS